MPLYTRAMLEDMKMNLHYDPETGVVTYKNSRYGTKVPGEEAGWVDGEGYLCIVYREMKYLLHRICWALYYDEWPKYTIDHVDRNPLNNKIDNLRDVPQGHNNYNKGRYKNQGLYRGVSVKDKQYQARISKDGVTKTLGCFKTPEEAAMAYDKAAIDYFGDHATLNFPQKFLRTGK